MCLPHNKKGNVMKEKLEECFRRLQELDIKPTLKNMENLVQSLYEIRDVYNELTKLEAEHGRNKADPEGRNDP